MISSSKPLLMVAVRLRLAVALAPLVFCLPAHAAQAQDADSSPPAESQPELRKAHRPHRAPTVDDQLDRLTAQLHLTPDQRGRAKVILEHRRAQMLQLREVKSLTAMDRFTKLQAIKRDALEKINALLTDEQRKTFRLSPPPPAGN